MKKIIIQNVNTTGKLNHELLNEMEMVINELAVLNLEEMESNEYLNFNDYLNEIIANQQEDGSFPLVIDSTIPNDCYYYYVARPTYVMLKVLVAYGNPMHYDAIKKCLNCYCKYHTFGGHGYDYMSEKIKNVTMLLEVNVLSHCNQEMDNHFENSIVEIRNYLLNKYSGKVLELLEDEQRFLNYVDEYSFLFYGTLCKNCISHELIENAAFIGNVVIPNISIINLDGLVSIKEDNNKYFKNAELYQLDELNADEIDEYEGSQYTKKKVFVACRGMLFNPSVYVFNKFEKEINKNKIAILF